MEQGTGTFGSRMAVMAGNAVAEAATGLRWQALNAAAELLEVAVSDLELTDGVIAVRGVPGRSVEVRPAHRGGLPPAGGLHGTPRAQREEWPWRCQRRSPSTSSAR
jgi:CO/xanthine dehydrogenase Mo-binding subunit